MKPVFQIILKVPSILFMLLRVYLSFRSKRRSYLRRFSRTVNRSLEDREAASVIIRHQKDLLSVPFMKMMKSILES